MFVLALAFLFPALEASIFVGVLVPGEIGVVLGGVLANQHKLPLSAVLVAAIAGAIIGDSVGYWVGNRYGEWILSSSRTGSSMSRRSNVPKTPCAATGDGPCSSAGSLPPCGR